MNIEKQIQQRLAKVSSGAHLWVGYSGGLDSTVLLHVLSELGVTCSAVHVNHGLSINADIWQHQCQRFAAEREIPFHSISVNVEPSGQGLESAARTARYNAIKQLLAAGDVLLTGHHLDDQVETFFLRLLRGAGLAGMGAMREQRSLGAVSLMRPLLGVTKRELREYATQHQLSWVEDESNEDTQFDRNFLRNTVLPHLTSRWSSASDSICSTIEHLQSAEDLLAEYGQQDLNSCDVKEEKLGVSVSLEALAHLSLLRINHVLRIWLKAQGYKLPDRVKMAEIQKVIHAKDDACPMLHIGEYSISRFKQRLYCLPRRHLTREHLGPGVKLESIPGAAPLIWNPLEPLLLGDGSRLSFKPEEGGVPMLSVSFRQGGERCRPQGRKHSQTLKKLMQEYDVPPWLRSSVPLIHWEGELIAVGDFWRCELSQGRAPAGQFEWCFVPPQ